MYIMKVDNHLILNEEKEVSLKNCFLEKLKKK